MDRLASYSHGIAFGIAIVTLLTFLPVPITGATIQMWGTPILVENDGDGDSWSYGVGIDNDGNAIAVWAQWTVSETRIWMNHYVMGEGWGVPQRLDNEDSLEPWAPSIAVNEQGDAIVAWHQYTESTDSRFEIWASRYTVGEGWSLAEHVEPEGLENATYAKVAINNEGDAMVTWTVLDSTPSVWANQYSTELGWGTPEPIEHIVSPAIAPEVVIDCEGNATVVWQQYDGTHESIWANRYNVTTGWGDPELVESDDSMDAFWPDIVVDESGNAWAVWFSQDEDGGDVWANHHVSGEGWNTPEVIEANDASDAFDGYPDVCMDRTGNAVVVWRHHNDTHSSVWANHYTADAGWNTAEAISGDYDGFAVTPCVGLDDNGHAITVWRQENGDYDDVLTSRFDTDIGWDEPESIGSSASGDVFSLCLAVNSDGDAVAVWDQEDGLRSIWSNRYFSISDSDDPITSTTCIGATGNDDWYVSPVEVELDANDEASGVNRTLYRLEGTDWISYTDTIVIPEDGIHTIEFFSEDLAGNSEEIKNISIRIDKTVPEVGSIGKSGGVDPLAQDSSWYSTEVRVTIPASDATSGIDTIMYRIDEGDWRTYSSTITISSSGNHSIDYYAVDAAGNIGDSAREYVKIDRQFGFLMITSIGDGETARSGDLLLTWACGDEDSGIYRFFVNVDGVSIGAYESSVREIMISDLSEGHHEIQLMAMDNAGNFGASIVDIYVSDSDTLGLALTILLIFAVGAAIIVVAAFAFLKWVK